MTSRSVPESSLPEDISLIEAVEAAYAPEIEATRDALKKRLPALIECDKELTPYFYRSLRDRLKRDDFGCIYIDGRAAGEQRESHGLAAAMLAMLRDAVRGATSDRVLVLPHLNLLTTSSGGLTNEARDAISLLYENPSVVLLGFKDPSFPVPRVIERLFAHRESILGIPRDRLAKLVTRREARKLGPSFDPFALYKYVSGVNAVRLRRVLSTLDGEDYPPSGARALDAVRRSTLGPSLSIPDVHLDRDIGGYERVKKRLREEILDILARKETLANPDDIKRIEQLVPRGMIFCGPPGTGKTLFAKAMASALGAAVVVVSGPELKSRWVGESEENLRQVFVSARKSAPAIIIFDELDSFAAARGTFTGSGVEHSMVNQLLTEMDGFRSDELVFVVGTTNFVESLDQALLRPGRFEFMLHIPFPETDDRRAILQVHDAKLGLQMTERALERAVRCTASGAGDGDQPFSGDHLQALCRQIARTRLREDKTGPTEVDDVDKALDAHAERPDLTPAEERVVATHEAGHAICALSCEHAPPIERISIRGDVAGALGFVRYGDHAHRFVTTRGQLLDAICVLFGGREAEALLCRDVSAGASRDLARAASLARLLVEEHGLGSTEMGVRITGDGPRVELSEATRAAFEAAERRLLEEQQSRARGIVAQNRASLEALRDLLLEHKVVERDKLANLMTAATDAARSAAAPEAKPPRKRGVAGG